MEGRDWLVKGSLSDLTGGYGRTELKDLWELVNRTLPHDEAQVVDWVKKLTQKDFGPNLEGYSEYLIPPLDHEALYLLAARAGFAKGEFQKRKQLKAKLKQLDTEAQEAYRELAGFWKRKEPVDSGPGKTALDKRKALMDEIGQLEKELYELNKPIMEEGVLPFWRSELEAIWQ